jgi:F0F1-type ATP synthase delta subunit
MKINPEIKQDLISYIKDRLSGATKPKVQVIAPYRLSDEEVTTLKKKISVLEHAEIELVVDKIMLAGIIIKYGSQMIDLSLDSELHKLEQKLYETA